MLRVLPRTNHTGIATIRLSQVAKSCCRKQRTVLLFATQSVHIGRFTGPRQTCLTAGDATSAYSVTTAWFYPIRSQYLRNLQQPEFELQNAQEFFSTRFAGMLHHTLHVFDVRDLRQSWILDSTLRFRVPGTGFLLFSVILGFGIVIFNKIPNFLNCIPDSRTQDSGFHKEIFPIFRIPQPTFSRKAHKPPSYIYEGNLLRQQR